MWSLLHCSNFSVLFFMQNVRMVYKKKLIWYIRRIKKDDGLLTLCANTPPNPQATWSCGWLCVTCRLCALSHVKEDQPHLFLSPPRPLWCQVYCNGGLHLISNGLPTLDDSKDILEKVLYGIKLRAKDKQIHPLSPPPPLQLLHLHIDIYTCFFAKL